MFRLDENGVLNDMELGLFHDVSLNFNVGCTKGTCPCDLQFDVLLVFNGVLHDLEMCLIKSKHRY